MTIEKDIKPASIVKVIDGPHAPSLRSRTSLNLQRLKETAQQYQEAEPVNVSAATARRHIGPQLRVWLKAGWLDEDIVKLFASEEPTLIMTILTEAREAEARARRKRKKAHRAKSTFKIAESTKAILPTPPEPRAPPPVASQAQFAESLTQKAIAPV